MMVHHSCHSFFFFESMVMLLHMKLTNVVINHYVCQCLFSSHWQRLLQTAVTMLSCPPLLCRRTLTKIYGDQTWVKLQWHHLKWSLQKLLQTSLPFAIQSTISFSCFSFLAVFVLVFPVTKGLLMVVSLE